MPSGEMASGAFINLAWRCPSGRDMVVRLTGTESGAEDSVGPENQKTMLVANTPKRAAKPHGIAFLQSGGWTALVTPIGESAVGSFRAFLI